MVNTITTDVQQVTTRNKAKEIHKVAQAWVEKANEANVERMRQESSHNATQVQDTVLTIDPIWQALALC